MAVVTLSWQLGCPGDQIAEETANHLGYRVIGKNELYDMIVNATDQVSKELETNESLKTVEEEIQPDFFFRTPRRNSTTSSLLASLIYKAASQDNTIIKGYGAQFVLANRPHVLCVKLKGSYNFRVSTLQKEKQLDRRTAEKLVTKDDRERMGFVQYIFKRELTDIQCYDMIMDVEKLSQRTITDMIVNTTHSLESSHPLTEVEKESLNTLALGSQVEAIIQKKIPDITEPEVAVNTDGIVTISGNVTRNNEKTAIEHQVTSLPEVRGIVNKIRVGSPFKRSRRRA
jgi:cytidylate kinase